MANDLIPGNSLSRAAERVRAKREADRAKGVSEAVPISPVISTTSSVRARLNFIPDDMSLRGMVDQALSALSRGIRWARGSIINLVV